MVAKGRGDGNCSGAVGMRRRANWSGWNGGFWDGGREFFVDDKVGIGVIGERGGLVDQVEKRAGVELGAREAVILAGGELGFPGEERAGGGGLQLGADA